MAPPTAEPLSVKIEGGCIVNGRTHCSSILNIVDQGIIHPYRLNGQQNMLDTLHEVNNRSTLPIIPRATNVSNLEGASTVVASESLVSDEMRAEHGTVGDYWLKYQIGEMICTALGEKDCLTRGTLQVSLSFLLPLNGGRLTTLCSQSLIRWQPRRYTVYLHIDMA